MANGRRCRRIGTGGGLVVLIFLLLLLMASWWFTIVMAWCRCQEPSKG